MFNDIKVGPVTFHMYGLMIAIGFMAALLVSSYRGKKKNLKEDTIYGILTCSLVGGFLGCRILFYMVEIKNILADPSILWNFREGYVVYGGIIGGILANIIYVNFYKKESFLDYFDLIMPAVSLAQGFGRIGCFCAGCCYGRETNSWFHIMFTHSNYAPNGVALLPTQLISSVGNFCFFGLLLLFSHYSKVKGHTGAMYFILYGIGRFCIEFLRGDSERGSVGIFSTSQFISIGIVAIGIALFFALPILEKKLVEEEIVGE